MNSKQTETTPAAEPMSADQALQAAERAHMEASKEAASLDDQRRAALEVIGKLDREIDTAHHAASDAEFESLATKRATAQARLDAITRRASVVAADVEASWSAAKQAQIPVVLERVEALRSEQLEARAELFALFEMGPKIWELYKEIVQASHALHFARCELALLRGEKEPDFSDTARQVYPWLEKKCDEGKEEAYLHECAEVYESWKTSRRAFAS